MTEIWLIVTLNNQITKKAKYADVSYMIYLSPNSGIVALHVHGFLMSFYCDITIVQLIDGLCDCDFIMKKFANRCGVGPLAIRQLRTVV